jgi:glycosyltransferase involved in cell wall biosynthesis
MVDSSHPLDLAAVVLTRNVAGHITDCIATLGFADRVVVSDSFSDDNTVALAQAAGAEVIQRTFDNFAGQRNAAMEAGFSLWMRTSASRPSWRPRCGR